MEKKRDWFFFVFLPLAITWGADRVTKMAAMDLRGIQFYGPFGLTLHKNPGAILGLFADLPPVLRIVSLSTGGAFLIFVFLIIQILLPVRSLPMRIGMSILLGGILGNVADRIVWGEVTDFLLISTHGFTSPVFNVADALQWVGYFLVVYALLKEGKNIWPDDNLRKGYWVDAKYQLRYCMKLVGFGVAFALISGVYSYTFLKVALDDLVHPSRATQVDHILWPFVITYVIVSIVFVIILFYTGLILSHRAAGPIYAFRRFLENLLNGKYIPLKLRTGDEFVELEEVAEKLGNKMGLNKPSKDEELPNAQNGI